MFVRIATIALDEKHITETTAKPATCKFSIIKSDIKFTVKFKPKEVHQYFKQFNELHSKIEGIT